MYLTTLDRDFDRLARRAFGAGIFAANGADSGWGTLPMDTVRRGGEVVLRFDVPGVDPDHIEVTVDHGYLTVSATREETPAEDDEHVVRERYYGNVTRRVQLSDNLDTGKIEASNDNGVLEIRVPVREESRPRKITVGAKRELAS